MILPKKLKLILFTAVSHRRIYAHKQDQ